MILDWFASIPTEVMGPICLLLVTIGCGISLFHSWSKSGQRHLKLVGIKDDCCRNEYNLKKIESDTLQCTYCKRIFYFIDKRTGERPFRHPVD